MHAYVWRVNGVDYPLIRLSQVEFELKFNISPAMIGPWPCYFTEDEKGNFLVWPKPEGPGELLKIEAFALARYGKE